MTRAGEIWGLELGDLQGVFLIYGNPAVSGDDIKHHAYVIRNDFRGHDVLCQLETTLAEQLDAFYEGDEFLADEHVELSWEDTPSKLTTHGLLRLVRKDLRETWQNV